MEKITCINKKVCGVNSPAKKLESRKFLNDLVKD